MSLTITLPAELEAKVTEAAARDGRQPFDYVLEAINNAVQAKHGANASLDEMLDWDCIQEAQAFADPTVTLEDVRKALSKKPGSMAEAVIAERLPKLKGYQ